MPISEKCMSRTEHINWNKLIPSLNVLKAHHHCLRFSKLSGVPNNCVLNREGFWNLL